MSKHGRVNELGVFCKREDEKQKLRMAGGSWYINLDEVDVSKVNRICYITDKATYEISARDAVTHGFRAILGGEEKLVVPIRFWEQKK